MRSLLLLFTLLLLFGQARSQVTSTTRISDTYNNIKLVEFFNRLEKSVEYKFYYDAVQLDSFIIQLNVKDLTVDQVLQEAFKGTDIRYSVDNSLKYIYVT